MLSETMLRSLKLVMFAVTKDFMFSRVIPYLFLLALCLPVLSSGQLPKQNAGEDPFLFFTDTAGLPEGILQKQKFRALRFLSSDRSDLDLLKQAERRNNRKAVAFISGRLGTQLAEVGQTDSAIHFFIQSQATFSAEYTTR